MGTNKFTTQPITTDKQDSNIKICNPGRFFGHSNGLISLIIGDNRNLILLMKLTRDGSSFYKITQYSCIKGNI